MADTNGLAPSQDLHKQLNLAWSVQGHQAMWCDVVNVPSKLHGCATAHVTKKTPRSSFQLPRSDF